MPAPLASLPGASTGLNLTRLAVTFGIEILSFYLLEQPIRRGRMPVLGPSAKRFVVATGVAIFAVSGISVEATVADPNLTTNLSIGDCSSYTVCVRHSGPSGAPVLAVIGNSIAKSLDPAFLQMASDHGWTYVLEANGSCRVSHLHSVPTTDNANLLPPCYDETPGLQQQLLSQWHPKVVVMADFMETMSLVDSAGNVVKGGSSEAVKIEQQALGQIARLVTSSGANMALLKLPPQLGTDCAKTSNFNEPDCTFTIGPTHSSKTQYDAMYDQLSRGISGVSTLSVTSVVCPNNICTPQVGGVVLRSDGLHYTHGGAMAVLPTLTSQILALGVLS